MANPWTSHPESALAVALGRTSAEVTRARAVFTDVQNAPYALPMRTAMLVQLLDAPGVNIGTTFATRMLELPAISHLAALLDVRGIGMGRLADVVSALAPHDPTQFAGPSQPQAPGTDQMLLRDIAASAGEQLGATQSTLKRNNHALKLGPVSLTLRGAMTQTEGEELAMRFTDTLVPDAASNVVLNYQTDALPSTPETQMTVPDVRGYTLALAARKLGATGLGAASMWMVATKPQQSGRVLRQRPAPGQPLKNGQTVTLFLGRLPSNHATRGT